MSSQDDLSDEQLKALYVWIDAIPLTRPKRNIARDFCDGVLFAEVVAAYFPTLVEIHNFTPANSTKQKVYNFETLNARVLKKINYNIPRTLIDEIVNCKPGAVEVVLNSLQFKMAKYRENKTSGVSPLPSPRRSEGAENGYINESQSVQKSPAKSSSGKNNGGKSTVMASVDQEILIEKEQQIRELQETVEILELKIAKLEQLVRLKDNKIQKLLQK